MKFVWDELKNRNNIRKHGIDFEDAVEMFRYPMLSCIDVRRDYGEERWVGIGFMKGAIVVVAYTEDDETDRIRIISVRKATMHESQRFKETIGY